VIEWPATPDQAVAAGLLSRSSASPSRAGTPVCIALSTHNGSAFLHEQLASILRQTHGDWTLLWRDDGSTDQTLAMVRAFAEQAGPGRVVDANDARGRLGITGSYMALLRRVPPGQVLAFADQDDLWLEQKLARGVAALARVDAARPALYCARQILVDAAGRRLGESACMTRPTGFPQSLTQNIATGCTVMLNPPAVRLLTAMRAPPGTHHDWWSYLVVTAAGGAVLIDPEPTVHYRQHPANAVGARRRFWPRALAAVRRGPGAFMTTFKAHVAALEDQHDLLDPQAQETLSAISAGLQGGLLRRMKALGLPGFRRQNFAETQLFRLWFLLG
jgi:glycosyltransferase involved in cell wall biosynthesis